MLLTILLMDLMAGSLFVGLRFRAHLLLRTEYLITVRLSLDRCPANKESEKRLLLYFSAWLLLCVFLCVFLCMATSPHGYLFLRMVYLF